MPHPNPTKLPGYDAWKTSAPSQDARECPECQCDALRYDAFLGRWVCSECVYSEEPDPDAALEALRDEREREW